MDVLQNEGNVFRETSLYLASYTALEAEDISLAVDRLTTPDLSYTEPCFR